MKFSFLYTFNLFSLLSVIILEFKIGNIFWIKHIIIEYFCSGSNFLKSHFLNSSILYTCWILKTLFSL